jgi:uncharacterized membrane protein YkoI
MLDESKKLDMSDLDKVVGGKITGEEAYNTALKHANKTKKQAKFKKCEPDHEHGRKIYEVEFVSGGFEYEYEIDADTGEVLKAEKEFWD